MEHQYQELPLLSQMYTRHKRNLPCAIPMAMAVLPVEGGPAIKTARPAILPALIIFKMTPAALRAFN